MAGFLRSIDPLTDSNCYLIEEEGHVLIIDPNQKEEITDIVKKHQWVIDYVLLTHEHCDHMQGLNNLRRTYKFQVIAQEKCSKNLGNRIKNMSGMMGTYLYFKSGQKEIISYDPVICDPADLTFCHQYELLWKGHRLEFTSVPGHTEGSCCIRMDQNTLFSGDYLLPGGEDHTIFPGGSKEDYERYAKPWLSNLENGLHIYPGHGKDYILGQNYS